MTPHGYVAIKIFTFDHSFRFDFGSYVYGWMALVSRYFKSSKHATKKKCPNRPKHSLHTHHSTPYYLSSFPGRSTMINALCQQKNWSPRECDVHLPGALGSKMQRGCNRRPPRGLHACALLSYHDHFDFTFFSKNDGSLRNG
jgi:hypothetical protein